MIIQIHKLNNLFINSITMRLYYHKTDGGAEYLTDTFIVCPNGEKEGVFNGAKYIVRLDGDITKDAELDIRMNEEFNMDELTELDQEALAEHVRKGMSSGALDSEDENGNQQRIAWELKWNKFII